jgi:hypothetical protein
MVSKITDPIIEALEKGRIKKFGEGARELNLAPATVKEFQQGAAYPDAARAAVKLSTPEVIVDALNRTGLSAEYQHHLNCVWGWGQIVIQGRRLNAKLDELLAQARKHKKEDEAQTKTVPVGG